MAANLDSIQAVANAIAKWVETAANHLANIAAHIQPVALPAGGGGGGGPGGGLPKPPTSDTGGGGTEKAVLSIANTLGGSLGDMAAKVADVVVPGLGTLGETVVNVVSQIIELPGKILNAIEPFVNALNPTLLLSFNQQLDNLKATVGTAFQDVFDILAPALDAVAGYIQDAMTGLRPLIDAITEAFGTYLVNAFKNFAILTDTLKPLISVLIVMVKYVEGVIVVFQTIYTVLFTVLEAFMEFLGITDVSAGLETVLKELENAVKDTITAFLSLVGYIAKFLGQNAFLDRLISNLTKKPGEHALAAPKDVGIKGIEQLTKDIAIAAFTAGGGTERSQTDYLSDAVNRLSEIKNNGVTMQEILRQILEKLDPRNKVREQVEEWRRNHPTATGFAEGVLPAGALNWLLGG